MRAPCRVVAQRGGGARYIWAAGLPDLAAAQESAQRCLTLQDDVVTARIVDHLNVCVETCQRARGAVR